MGKNYTNNWPAVESKSFAFLHTDSMPLLNLGCKEIGFWPLGKLQSVVA